MKKKKRLVLALLPVLLAGMLIGIYIYFQPGIEVGGIFMRQISDQNGVAEYTYENQRLITQHEDGVIHVTLANHTDIEPFRIEYLQEYDTFARFTMFQGNTFLCDGVVDFSYQRATFDSTSPEYEALISASRGERFPEFDVPVLAVKEILNTAFGFNTVRRGVWEYAFLGFMALLCAGILFFKPKRLGLGTYASAPGVDMQKYADQAMQYADNFNAGSSSVGNAVTSSTYRIFLSRWMMPPSTKTADGMPYGQKSAFSKVGAILAIVLCCLSLWFFLLSLQVL